MKCAHPRFCTSNRALAMAGANSIQGKSRPGGPPARREDWHRPLAEKSSPGDRIPRAARAFNIRQDAGINGRTIHLDYVWKLIAALQGGKGS